MRIAIYHNLPSGGGKRALCEMTKGLTKTHDIDVYSLATGEHDFCDLRPHCAKHIIFPFRTLPIARRPFGRLNQGIRGADLLRLEMLQRHIAANIDHARYDVVFVHNCRLSQSPGLLKYLRTPSAYYCAEPPRLVYEPQVMRPYNRPSPAQRLANSIDPLPLVYRALLRRLDQANVRAASAVLVNSHYSRETLYRTYNVLPKVSYLGVNSTMFRPLQLPKAGFVLSVGQLSPSKGFDFLIRCLALLKPEARPPLILVSNIAIEAEQNYLQALADANGVLVTFKVRIGDDDLASLYNRSQLTLYAPVMEPFGFVPLESMACGTPIIGVREGGVRESILHERTGLLIERDEASFAAAIAALLGDNRKRDFFSESGRSHVIANWSWERAVKQIEKHILKLVAA